MRWMVWVLVAFATAVGLALLMRFNHGNVAILWPPYRVEISVNLALALLLALFGALHLLLVGTARALRLPQRVRDYRQRRQQDIAVGALRDSVLAFFEGRHGRVERHALLARTSPVTAAPAALLAARSAQRMQEQSRRDRWLQEAQGDAGAGHGVMQAQSRQLRVVACDGWWCWHGSLPVDARSGRLGHNPGLITLLIVRHAPRR